MEKESLEGEEKFFSVYRKLSPTAREATCILIDEKPYDWNVVFNEIIKKTELGKRMLEKLIRLKKI